MRLIRRLWQGINAASVVAWLYAIGGGGVVGTLTGVVVQLAPIAGVSLAASLALIGMATVLLVAPRWLPLPKTPEPTPQLDRSARNAAMWVVVNHNLMSLGPELNRLHHLFTEARDTTDSQKLSSIKQVFQLRVEPIIRNELTGHSDLLAHFYDDTGFGQQSSYEGPPERTKMANFLERRHMRLKECIDRLREIQAAAS